MVVAMLMVWQKEKGKKSFTPMKSDVPVIQVIWNYLPGKTSSIALISLTQQSIIPYLGEKSWFQLLITVSTSLIQSSDSFFVIKTATTW